MPTHEPYKTHSTEWQRIHCRVRSEYGLASTYQCSECKKPAREWAWQHGEDPSSIESYWPMCKPCHRRYDQTDEWQENVNAALPRGEKVAQAMLREAEVLEIRARYAVGDISQRKLADIYCVNAMTINKIVNRVTWGWL